MLSRERERGGECAPRRTRGAAERATAIQHCVGGCQWKGCACEAKRLGEKRMG